MWRCIGTRGAHCAPSTSVDSVHSLRATIDINGFERYFDYAPFGAMIWSTSGSADRLSFNDNEKDRESGLYSLGARMYNDSGEFQSVDPLWSREPGKSPYHYVNGDPLRYVDPTGMQKQSIWMPFWKDGSIGVPSGGVSIYEREMARAALSGEGAYRPPRPAPRPTRLEYESNGPAKAAQIRSAGSRIDQKLAAQKAGSVPAEEAAARAATVRGTSVSNDVMGRSPAEARAAQTATKAEVKLSAEAQRGIRSLERRIAEHERKLAEFKANPTVRPGMEKLPKEVVQRQQQIRIKHLETEIQTFKNNIEKLKRGE